MTQSISYSAIHTLQPQTIKGFDCDGIIDDKPVRIRRNRFGGLVPTVGSTLLTTYGTARVTGYSEGSLKVAIIKFNDDYAFETADGLDIFTAQEQVATLSQCANRSIDSIISDITRIYKSDITDKLPKSWQEKVDAIEYFAPNEFVMDLTDKSDPIQLLDGSVIADVVAIERETKEDRKKRRAIEIAEAKRLRRQLLDAYDAENAECPDDIANEIADEFGDVDTDENIGEDGEF